MSRNKLKISCMGASTIAVEKCEYFQGNLKILSKENYAKLRKEMMELGFSEPISVWRKDDHHYLLNGTQRIRTLRQMIEAGEIETCEIPCNFVEAKSEAEARRKVLALTSQYGEMDSQGLYEFMTAAGITMEEIEESFRFPEIELKSFRSEYFDTAMTKEDAVPENIKARVKTGELWELGAHRLLCGDATKTEDVSRLMGDEKADLFFTDPPYLVDYTGDDQPQDGGKDWSENYKEVEIEDAEQFFLQTFSNAKQVLTANAAWYCWHASKRQRLIEDVWQRLGIHIHQQIVWVKPSPILTFSYWPWQHEPCLVGWPSGEDVPVSGLWEPQHEMATMGWPKGDKPFHDGLRSGSASSVWFADYDGQRRPSKNAHPTQKPLKLFENAIKKHTRPGALLYEPFAGSGSQIIAAQQLGRRCYAIEIEPRFCDVILARLDATTGEKAKRKGV